MEAFVSILVWTIDAAAMLIIQALPWIQYGLTSLVGFCAGWAARGIVRHR